MHKGVRLKRKAALTVLNTTQDNAFDGAYNRDFEAGHSFNRIAITSDGDWLLRDSANGGASIFAPHGSIEAFEEPELVSLPQGKWRVTDEAE